MDRHDYRHQYLKTERWRRFRDTILATRCNCERCGLHDDCSAFFYCQRLDIHHLTYQNLGNEKPEDVQVLCRACHEIAETEKNPPKGRFTGYPGLVEFLCPRCSVMTGVILFRDSEGKLPHPKFWTRCRCTQDDEIESCGDESRLYDYCNEDATSYIRRNFNPIMEWRRNYGDLKK